MKDKLYPLSVGAVSEGTLKPEDLIPKFLKVMELQMLALRQQFEAEWSDELAAMPLIATIESLDQDPEWQERLGEMLEAAINKIDENLPEGYWFGQPEGDGACFGIWEVWAADDTATTGQDDDKASAGPDETRASAPRARVPYGAAQAEQQARGE